MPKKKFIDKKNSVTFHLVHRSQQDPLVADETAPQRVLIPAAPVQSQKPQSATDKQKRIEEQHKYGIYFDDDYNYLQHLRDTSNTMEWERVERTPAEAKIKLPSSVFASTVEEDVGLLNKAAPVTGLQLDLDPDVIAALDDDFDFDDPENELEDNFVELANGEGDDDDVDDGEVASYEGTDEEEEMFWANGEDAKSKFTDYSMSSSVIRRNDQLSLLDSRFETVYEGYDENEIGPLDCEEIEGYVPETSDVLLKLADEFEKEQTREKLDKDKTLKLQEMESDSEDEELVKMPVKEKEKWDCESILSTYSNIYNRPKLIEEPSKSKIRINRKTGVPLDILNSNRLTMKALLEHNERNDNVSNKLGPKSVGAKSIISMVSTLSIRNKDETPEEKKERKRLLREYRRERRVEKKANTEAFKLEAKRQAKIAMNDRKNVQGNKIL